MIRDPNGNFKFRINWFASEIFLNTTCLIVRHSLRMPEILSLNPSPITKYCLVLISFVWGAFYLFYFLNFWMSWTTFVKKLPKMCNYKNGQFKKMAKLYQNDNLMQVRPSGKHISTKASKSNCNTLYDKNTSIFNLTFHYFFLKVTVEMSSTCANLGTSVSYWNRCVIDESVKGSLTRIHLFEIKKQQCLM
jgi:hypothetical protein